MTNDRHPKPKEQKQINKARALCGLPELKNKTKTCLRCDRKFVTNDSKNQHTCFNCRQEFKDDRA